MAEAYLKLHPRGTAVVTQFSARPQLLVRQEKTHRASALTYGESIFSPMIPPPTAESVRYVIYTMLHCRFNKFVRFILKSFNFLSRNAYRIAGSFNNFHGRLSVIFHILSDDKVGSTPRFAPGSKAKPALMEVDGDDEVTEVAPQEGESSSRHTPLRGVTNQVKRKAGQLFSGTSGSASKKK
jgi:hypothetical protein